MKSELQKAMEYIDMKFVSRNSVPAERAPLTKKEWDLIRPVIAAAVDKNLTQADHSSVPSG